MSEEAQDIKEEQKTEEAPVAEEPQEKKAANSEAAQSPSENKIKKINKIPVDKLNNKIKLMEESNNTNSKYYKHLMQRKKELENITV